MQDGTHYLASWLHLCAGMESNTIITSSPASPSSPSTTDYLHQSPTQRSSSLLIHQLTISITNIKESSVMYLLLIINHHQTNHHLYHHNHSSAWQGMMLVTMAISGVKCSQQTCFHVSKNTLRVQWVPHWAWTTEMGSWHLVLPKMEVSLSGTSWKGSLILTAFWRAMVFNWWYIVDVWTSAGEYHCKITK